ncbi:fimbrial protein [Escherichia coli]|uniref:fimbrial protein n=1 Tax=Escherichia coli TaxID=562 RepID=UPI003FCF834C
MKRSIIAAAVFSSFFMSAGVFAADVDTGTLTIKGNIAESPCKFEVGGDSVSINMPTVPTTVFEGKAKYSTYDDAVGVTSSMLKISCPKEVAGVKLSLITNDKITGNDKAIASSNDTVGYYLYLGDNSDVLDISAPFNIESYKTAEGQYAIPFKAKYLKLTDNSVQSGDVLSSLVMRVAQD